MAVAEERSRRTAEEWREVGDYRTRAEEILNDITLNAQEFEYCLDVAAKRAWALPRRRGGQHPETLDGLVRNHAARRRGGARVGRVPGGVQPQRPTRPRSLPPARGGVCPAPGDRSAGSCLPPTLRSRVDGTRSGVARYRRWAPERMGRAPGETARAAHPCPRPGVRGGGGGLRRTLRAPALVNATRWAIHRVMVATGLPVEVDTAAREVEPASAGLGAAAGDPGRVRRGVAARRSAVVGPRGAWHQGAGPGALPADAGRRQPVPARVPDARQERARIPQRRPRAGGCLPPAPGVCGAGGRTRQWKLPCGNAGRGALARVALAAACRWVCVQGLCAGRSGMAAGGCRCKRRVTPLDTY